VWATAWKINSNDNNEMDRILERWILVTGESDTDTTPEGNFRCFMDLDALDDTQFYLIDT
jgi:hypothetical protein